MLFSPRFKFLRAVRLKKQDYMVFRSQPTTSSVYSECPVASIPCKDDVCVNISVRVIKLCTFVSAFKFGILIKAISTWLRAPM